MKTQEKNLPPRFADRYRRRFVCTRCGKEHGRLQNCPTTEPAVAAQMPLLPPPPSPEISAQGRRLVRQVEEAAFECGEWQRIPGAREAYHELDASLQQSLAILHQYIADLERRAQ